MSKSNHVSVIGQGYVGLPLALAAAHAGWNVVGIEVDSFRFSQLNSGISPIEGVENSTIESAISTGLYRAEHNFESLQQANIIIVCVPTPLDIEGKPDLSALNEVISAIHERGAQDALIINESTCYPGTLRQIFYQSLENLGSQRRFEYAVAPERIDPGNEAFSIESTPRVIGALSEGALIKAAEFYDSFCRNVIKVSSPEVAELAKLLENSFRLVNISLINEISKLSTKIGVSIREVIDAANTKPFGFMRFSPSIGIGGHCIPVDPVYLSEFSHNQGIDQILIKNAKVIDEEIPHWVLQQIRSLSQDIEAITVVGIGYKSGSRDTRHSSSIRLIKYLREMGYRVDWIDSVVQSYGEESSSSDLSSQLVILVSIDKSFNPKNYLEKGGIIMDFTGTLKAGKGIFSY